MNAVFFIGVGQAIFIAALIMAKEEKRPSDHILLVWMLLNACQILFFHASFVGQTERFIPVLIVGGTLQFLVAPLLYFYILTLTKTNFFVMKYWPHGLPFLFFCGSILYYYWHGGEHVQVWIENGYINSKGAVPFYIWGYPSFLAFVSLVYPLMSLIVLFRHRRRVLQEFSYQEKITLDWLRHWVALELTAFLISYIVIWAGELDYMLLMDSFKVTAGLIMLNIFVVGYFGIQQPIIFKNATEERDEKPKYRTSTLKKDESEHYMNQLSLIMTRDKPYLNNKLGITELSDLLGISKHHLSQILNDYLQTNFYDFVNGFRVDEFKDRLLKNEYDRLTLLGIALDCGFNSKSSFNQVFKKSEGITPTEYKKVHRN